jgi:undecaprenyl-diphosphatase
MIDFFKITFLSLLQGVAEFLPISSSGHLALAKHFFGFEDIGLRLDIFLHVGTLFAVVFFYRKTVLQILIKRDWSYIVKILLSAVPIGAVVFFFKDFLLNVSSMKILSLSFLFTGVVLFLNGFVKKSEGEITFLKSIAIGLAQAVAALPGVSRSGMTITAARAVGVSSHKSAEFSFLMSIVPIGGAALLDLVGSMSLAGEQGQSVSWALIIWGMFISLVSGYLSLSLLTRIVNRDTFWMFAPYCILLGVIVQIFS